MAVSENHGRQACILASLWAGVREQTGSVLSLDHSCTFRGQFPESFMCTHSDCALGVFWVFLKG